MVTALWLLFEIVTIWLTDFLTRKMTRREQIGLVLLGVLVAVVGGLSECNDSAKMDALKSGQDFTRGQLDVIAKIAGTPKIDSIGDLKGQLESLHASLETYVMPRRLTDTQMGQISAYLHRFEPHYVVLRVQPEDPEAIQYAGQIVAALSKGGWTVGVKGEETTGTGLVVDVKEPMPPMLAGGGIGRMPIPQSAPDPNHPTMDALIYRAFNSAQVDIGSSSTFDKSGYSCSLLVAHRPVAIRSRVGNGNSN